MLRPAFLSLALFLLFVCAAQPAFAARQDAGAFSADLPDNWTMTREGDMTVFAEPEGPVELTIILKKYHNPDIKAIIIEMAGQTPVRMLADNCYVYEDSSGSRGWSMLAADGTFADIGVNMPCENTGAFLAGLAAAKGEKGLAEIFAAAASSDEAMEWLAYADGGKGDPADDADDADAEEATPYEHKTFTAMVPQGWSVTEKDGSVVFASEAGDCFVIVRVFPLESDDGKAFAAWAGKQARALGGKDVTTGEGVVEFTTEEGASGMFTQFDNKCLFLLFDGESLQMGNLIRSIGLTD